MSLSTNQVIDINLTITNVWGQKCELDRNCNHPETDYQKACLNGGKCITDENGNPTCDCKDTNFYGEYCENVHPCHPMKKTCGNRECRKSENSKNPGGYTCNNSQI